MFSEINKTEHQTMEININNQHNISTLGLDFQDVLRTSNNRIKGTTQGRLEEALTMPRESICELPIKVQEELMDYLFEDGQFEFRGLNPNDFDPFIFGALPGDILNIRLIDILSFDWELQREAEDINELISKGKPLIIFSASLVFLGRYRGGA
jgi:hypothetical protein